jgi:hypothetical protein
MPIDPDILAAVKKTKREAHAELSHRRQLRRIGARKRANIAASSAASQSRTQQASQVAAARSASAQSIIQSRSAARTATIEQQLAIRHEEAGATRRRRVISNVGGSAVDAVTPSSDSNLFMITIFTMAGLIVVYHVVTNGQQFSGFLGKLGDFLHILSSPTPLFQVAKKV